MNHQNTSTYQAHLTNNNSKRAIKLMREFTLIRYFPLRVKITQKLLLAKFFFLPSPYQIPHYTWVL